MLKIGDFAPAFAGSSTQGEIKLSDYKGKNVVLIFYPQDFTPGCTKQLCSAQSAHDDYAGLDAVVVAVNPGSLESHRRFAEKYGLRFPIVEDAEGTIRNAYDVPKILGLLGQRRCVFLIGKDGRIAYVRKGHPSTEELTDVLKKRENRTVASEH